MIIHIPSFLPRENRKEGYVHDHKPPFLKEKMKEGVIMIIQIPSFLPRHGKRRDG